MARLPVIAPLPDYTALGESPTPVSRLPIVEDDSQEAIGNAVTKASDQVFEQGDQMSYAQAKSQVLQTDIAARRAMETDPDPATAMQRYQATMSQARAAASQKIWSAKTRSLFQAETAVDIQRGMSVASGIALEKQKDAGRASLDSLLTGNRESALNAGDPDTRSALIDSTHQAIRGAQAKGYISADDAVKIQRNWAQDFAKGYVEIQPADKQVQLLTKPQGTPADMIDPAERAVLLHQAQTRSLVEQERAQHLAEKAKKDAQDRTQNTFLSRMQTNQLTVQDVLRSNLDPFGSGSKDEFLNMLKPKAGQRTDPATFNDLFTRIHAEDTDPNKIIDPNALNQYVIQDKLSMEDLSKLRGEIENRGTVDGENESQLKKGLFEVAKSSLTSSNPLLGIRDPAGDTQLQRFTSWFQTAYANGRKAGKSAQDLLSPDSKDYLGNQVKQYARSPQQIMNDLVSGVTAAPAPKVEPRKQGESAADYLKRTAGQ